MTLNIKNRDLVVPGDLLAKGDYLLGEGTYMVGDEIYANLLGLVDSDEKFIKIIPLSGRYIPKPGDLVIGVVEDAAFSHWYVELNSPFSGVLTVASATERFVNLNEENITDIYGIGDVVLAKVDNVSASLVAGLTMRDRGLFKLSGGRLLEISPTKVPRVIGKKGTMVQMIKNLTGCKIVVGQNGRVWVSGENSDIVVEVINLIESQAHISGLTDKVREFLEDKTGKKETSTGIALTKSTVEALEQRKALVEQKQAAVAPATPVAPAPAPVAAPEPVASVAPAPAPVAAPAALVAGTQPGVTEPKPPVQADAEIPPAGAQPPIVKKTEEVN